MVTWMDFISLFVTAGVFGGTIYGVVYVVKQVTESVKTTKEKMKDKGFNISQSGMSIKTQKRFDRQDYIDATQRGMMKTMTAASFNRRADSVDDSQSPISSSSNSNQSPTTATRPGNVVRSSSMASGNSNGSNEKKKRPLFGSRKSSD